MNEKLDEIDNESKANAGHVDNLREVNKELLERIKVNVQDDIDKQTGKCLISPWGQSWERVLHKHKCIQITARVPKAQVL